MTEPRDPIIAYMWQALFLAQTVLKIHKLIDYRLKGGSFHNQPSVGEVIQKALDMGQDK